MLIFKILFVKQTLIVFLFIKLETIKYQSNIEIDILVIKNNVDKPFFLTKDYSYQGKTIRAGVIHTRLVIRIFHLKSPHLKHKLN